jgi:hypothetical protein
VPSVSPRLPYEGFEVAWIAHNFDRLPYEAFEFA